MKLKLATILVSLVILGCKKDPNPYETYQRVPPVVINPVDTLDPNSFVGIHYNVFKPTCANSGCHDGTFEPDFRTVESAYNTLVYRPVTNPVGDYQYRVAPSDAENSVLYQRITTYFEGTQGVMPIQTDPGSDWPAKKDQYIQNIKNWINNGAKDQFGTTPTLGNLEPIFKGVIAKANGQTDELPRQSGKGTIIIPISVSKITLYFSLNDDDTPAASLTYNKLKVSNDPYQFTSKPELPLVIGDPISGNGYFNEAVDFTHSIEVDLAQYPVGETQYIRIYVRDSSPETTEIPKNGSSSYIHLYFSFVRR